MLVAISIVVKKRIGRSLDSKSTNFNINKIEKPNIAIPTGERYFRNEMKKIRG